jgi:hypothetical protein
VGIVNDVLVQAQEELEEKARATARANAEAELYMQRYATGFRRSYSGRMEYFDFD